MRSMAKLIIHRHGRIAFFPFPLSSWLTRHREILVTFPHIPSPTYSLRHAFLVDVLMSTAVDLFKHRSLSTRFLDHGGRRDQVSRRERQARAQTQQLAIYTIALLTPGTLTNIPLRTPLRL